MERVHTTTGEPPAVRLERERPLLATLPEVGFDPRVPEIRRVLSECTVSLGGARYSVPYAHVGSRVVAKRDPLGDAIEIFAGAECVARHQRAAKGARVIVEAHVAELRRPRWERLRQRAARAPARAAGTAHALVPWPLSPAVEQRDILVYAQAAGGGR
jgi:hypothetical protein